MNKQLRLFSQNKSQAYGGVLRNKARNRQARPLVTKSGSMHICLKSSQARGIHSFRSPAKREKVRQFVQEFSRKKGVQILNWANVGNHLHLHVKLSHRRLYYAWIRGLSSGLAMLAMGLNGLKELKQKNLKFWDYRPFSRVIQSFAHFLKTQTYVELNFFEGIGFSRAEARLLTEGLQRLTSVRALRI